MANRLRFRSGHVLLQKVWVDPGTVISAGDMVYLDTDDVKPASAFTFGETLAATQESFAAAFLGIAHQPSADGDTSPISVDVSPLAVYEFDVNAATYEVGGLLGPDESSSHLMSQQLEAATAARAIARAAEYKAASSSSLRVTFASAFLAGSGNVNAAIG